MGRRVVIPPEPALGGSIPAAISNTISVMAPGRPMVVEAVAPAKALFTR